MTDAVRLENVTFSYNGTPAIEDVSLSVPEGTFLGLVGPNGSGKTTLLKLILGILNADSGSIEVFGEASTDFSAGDRIGYVPQRSSRKGHTMPITVREVVTMGRFPTVRLGLLGTGDRKHIEEAIQCTGLSALSNKRLSRLSGGERQRVFIARALASGADLLALDEPTVGIDSESCDSFYALLNDLNNRGITIILIEHDIERVAEHAERIACLNRRLRYTGPSTEFLKSDARMSAYMSDRSVIDAPFEHVFF